VPILGNYFRRQLFQQFSFQYDAVVNYLEAHELTQCLIKDQLSSYEQVAPIIQESEEQVLEAEKYLNEQIEDLFPEISKSIQQRRAAYFILNHQFCNSFLFNLPVYVEELEKRGQIDEKEAKLLMQNITKKIHRLQVDPPEIVRQLS